MWLTSFCYRVLRYKFDLSHFGFTCVFFLKNLTLLFWCLKAIKGKLHFKQNLFIAKSIKIHSCENLVLCYYFKFFILFFPYSRPREKCKFHSTTLVILKIMQSTI